jgi:transposase InsO family protein
VKRFLIRDRDSIYTTDLDVALERMGIRILKTLVCAPQANVLCERLIGTIRRECLDFLIPLNEVHLRRILRERVAHYNKGRPRSSLGPGIPDPSEVLPEFRPPGISFRMITEWLPGLFWAVCITNIDSRKLPREDQTELGDAPNILAEYNYW